MFKSNSGLVEYAKAQLGLPYWYGTFGQIASESLFKSKARQFASTGYYTKWKDYSKQYGKRVHDCVGLIKGYLWSDNPTLNVETNGINEAYDDVKKLTDQWYELAKAEAYKDYLKELYLAQIKAGTSYEKSHSISEKLIAKTEDSYGQLMEIADFARSLGYDVNTRKGTITPQTKGLNTSNALAAIAKVEERFGSYDAMVEAFKTAFDNHEKLLQISNQAQIESKNAKSDLVNVIQEFFGTDFGKAREAVRLTYWNDEINDYCTGKFYIPDIDWTIYRVDDDGPRYKPIEITLIEY